MVDDAFVDGRVPMLAVEDGIIQRLVLLEQSGGELLLEWDGAGSVFMTGPAVEVFTGDWKGGG